MIERITKDAFKAIKGVSYSKLAKLADGPLTYKSSLEQPPTGSGLDFGSVVDVLLTSPETFNDEFYVMTADKPESEMMLTFVEVYAATEDQEKAWSQSGFKISLDRVLTKFYAEGKHYYDALILGKDKKIIDAAMVMKANQIVNALRTNPFTKDYIIPENENIEIHFQLPIVWTFETDDLTESGEREYERKHTVAKGIVDILKIDHNKKIIHIIDIKTGAEGFWKSFWRFKYYYQGAMYHDGVTAMFRSEYPDYQILPTKFIYMDTNLFNPPMIYSMIPKDIRHARVGYWATDKDGCQKQKYKGYERLAAELYWHEVNDKWFYPFEIYMNNGEVEIDAFSVKL